MICSRAASGTSTSSSQARPSPLSRCSSHGGAARGGRAPHGCAAATRRADRRACDATGPSSADRADDRAGSTTPAAARSSTAPADASRQRGRSSAASYSRAARSSAPAQPDAPRRQPAQLLNDEPPARRRLERDLELLAGKPGEKPAHALTVRRRHPRPADLPGHGVQPLRRDLRSVLIQSHYDRHRGLLKLHGLNTCANYPRLS